MSWKVLWGSLGVSKVRVTHKLIEVEIGREVFLKLELPVGFY